MDFRRRTILRCKRNTSITVAGLALGSLLLAGSPAEPEFPPPIQQRLERAYQLRLAGK